MIKATDYPDYFAYDLMDAHTGKVYSWVQQKKPIYRLFDKLEYMDRFYQDGELRISCIESFRSYPDEIRGDRYEGQGSAYINHENKDISLIIFDYAINGYILSTTDTINDKVIKAFNATCAIKIYNSAYFGLEIAKELQAVQQGIEGDCNYVDDKTIELDFSVQQDLINKSGFANDLAFQIEMQRKVSTKALFLKHKKYNYQKEYRLIWFSENRVLTPVVVKIPQARLVCEPIIF
ncbi:MAG TPA: hypothetical protein PLS73_13600 [Saprospiraceae bacterium]|nr:hypothetical protein [Saprospiraceae bacterium]